MFAIPGILLLLVFIYVRPLEFLLWLRVVPLLYIFCGLAIFGFAVDLRLKRVRPMLTPQGPWVAAFFVWCLITLLVKARDRLMADAISLAISLVLYLIIAHGVQTFRR